MKYRNTAWAREETLPQAKYDQRADETPCVALFQSGPLGPTLTMKCFSSSSLAEHSK